MPVLVAIAVGLALADASIVVLALPDIYGELGVTIVEVSWVITAYAAAVALVAVLARGTARRWPLAVTAGGLAVFATSSVLCSTADTLVALVTARAAQGAGGALLLVGAAPVLEALHPSGRRLWAAAGTVGLAAGPALGGALTEAFDWRMIFVVQAPIAALALFVVVDVRARSAAPGGEPIAGPASRRAAANVALTLLSAALVGALFLSVLMVVEVWRLSPLRGAGLVSALAAGSLAASWLRLHLVSGCVVLAGGLSALALLPDSSATWAAPALALCGIGLAVANRDLDELAADTGLVVASRHLGLVIGLAVLAPLLTASLERGADDAALAGTATLLDARASIGDKVDTAFAVRDVVERTPRGRMPELERFTALDDVVRDTLTRAFRTTFALAAVLALAAAVPAAVATRGAHLRSPLASGAFVALAVALVAVALGSGAAGFGARPARDPCRTSADPHPGDGLDATAQRIVLGGLDGAACELGTSREALVLSLDRDTSVVPLEWERPTIERAVRAGLVRAVDDAEARRSLPSWAATALHELAERAPVEVALVAADRISELGDVGGNVVDELRDLVGG